MLYPREARVLRLRLGIGVRPHSRREIAEMFRVSVGVVRGIERKALARIGDADATRIAKLVNEALGVPHGEPR